MYIRIYLLVHANIIVHMYMLYHLYELCAYAWNGSCVWGAEDVALGGGGVYKRISFLCSLTKHDRYG